ncbi:osmotically inducible protein OsmC [Pontibacter aydingkolensis]|uniref:OsmC family peroxiredoxin n=1 Tax=Pontibacter aydingkolensis TaxID=1911536 RepID=A0ABS7CNT7_9BACT|nr:OsmC family peroxiredoxin [Pontibacter aydingkolensis]MBW7465509.1 OsmC family peroxiredoxin [Pontibacter aydingkolensis]
MREHHAEATWEKGLKDGTGNIKTGNGTIESAYSYGTRFGNETNGTTPEELIGAALAGCYSMFLSALLGKENYTPDYIHTRAKVILGEKEGAPLVESISLTVEAKVAKITDEELQKLAQESKEKCPISKALKAIPEVNLQVSLIE